MHIQNLLTHHLVTVFLRLTCVLVLQVDALLSSDVKWTNELNFDTDFIVKWDSEDPDFLTMEISGPTTGYVGIGFSPRGDMFDSDIVIGWVDEMGIPHLKDYHGIGKTSPLEDTQQDYFLIAASERDNRTTVRFHRRWETCDEQHDIKIGNDTMKLIWAWHPEDPDPSGSIYPWHGISSRGTKNVFMRLPSKPTLFPDGDDGLSELPPPMKYWDLTVENVDVDGSEDSLFACKMFKFSNRLHYKYQMIGFRPILTEENEGNIFGISLYQCDFPRDLLDEETEGLRDVNGKSMECLTHNESGMNYCKTLFLSWALGSEGEMFPFHVGLPIEDSTGSPFTYFKLQIHYDNLFGKQFLDSSGIRIFYTNQPRLYEGGLLKVGHKSSPFLAVPPAQEAFRVYSLCSDGCIRRGIPETGLNIISVMLHGHSSLRKIRLRHIRNGKELPPVTEDNNYSYLYQQYRIMKDEVRILPGDELLLECEYNTANRDKFTFGGFSNADEEMCQALLLYYPRANLIACESKAEFQSFFGGFGIRNVIGEGLKRVPYNSMRRGRDLIPPQFQVEFYHNSVLENGEERNESPFDSVFITEPVTQFNVSVGEKMRNTDWRQKHVSKNLENSWKNGRHFVYCEGRQEIALEKHVDSIKKFEKYRRPSTSLCRRESNRRGSSCRLELAGMNLLVMLTISVITFAF